jgi:hypothetical protein
MMLKQFIYPGRKSLYDIVIFVEDKVKEAHVKLKGLLL